MNQITKSNHHASLTAAGYDPALHSLRSSFSFFFSPLNGTFGIGVVSLIESDHFPQWQTAKEANMFSKKTKQQSSARWRAEVWLMQDLSLEATLLTTACKKNWEEFSCRLPFRSGTHAANEGCSKVLAWRWGSEREKKIKNRRCFRAVYPCVCV